MKQKNSLSKQDKRMAGLRDLHTGDTSAVATEQTNVFNGEFLHDDTRIPSFATEEFGQNPDIGEFYFRICEENIFLASKPYQSVPRQSALNIMPRQAGVSVVQNFVLNYPKSSQLEAKKKSIEKDAAHAKREAIRTKILGYADFKFGRAPDLKDIYNARHFVRLIPIAGISTVRTMTDGGGDVGFEWGRELDLEIGFMDGNISFYGYTREGERIGDTQSYDSTVPAELDRLLSAIFSA